MPQAYRYISDTDAYMPVASKYVVSFIRKPDEFPLNKYIQYVEAPAPSFWYYELDRDWSIRVRDLALHAWKDGAERPNRTNNQPGFRQQQAWVNRYDFNSRVGNIALEQASNQWQAKTVYLEGLASQAHTARTINVWQGGPAGGATGSTAAWTGLDVAATWPTGQVAAANDLNGGAGTWDKAGSDPANPGNYMAIRKSIMAAANTVYLNTNGKVKSKDLRLCVDPTLANKMANSDEIRDAYKYGPYAKEFIEGEEENLNDRFGLPKRYAGVEIVVEDTPYLTDPQVAAQTVASTARQYVKAPDRAVLMSRPGKIDAQVGPSFSTIQLYWHEYQLRAQQFTDAKNEFTDFHVNDYYGVVGTALVAGFLILGASS